MESERNDKLDSLVECKVVEEAVGQYPQMTRVILSSSSYSSFSKILIDSSLLSTL